MGSGQPTTGRDCGYRAQAHGNIDHRAGDRDGHGGEELNRRAINDLDAISKAVPGLTIGEQGGNVQGGTVSMRGITGPNINVLGDQAVSFNMDGVAIARASVRQLGTFDLEQVEVLKGPQALFFGKNSPGGVISLRTADPTNSFQAKASIGYEANAHEIRGEGYVSGPLTESLGARLAVYYSHMRGWTRNTYPQGFDISPKKHGPDRTEFDIRGTLKFNNGGPFNARLKVSAGRAHGAGLYWNAQIIHCQDPGKMNFDALIVPGAEYDCRANDKVFHPDLGSSFAQYNPRFSKGEFSKTRQELVSLEMNYDFTEAIRLTSVTGYYHAFSDNASQYNYPIDVLLLPSAGRYRDREISEELRLASSFDGPINFTIGGLYSSTRTSVEQHTLFGTNPPPINFFGLPSPSQFNESNFYQHGKAWSVFGQLSWMVVPTVELSGGGRYSHEEKSLPVVEAEFFGGDPKYGTATRFDIIEPISFNNFSPEVSLSWRPTKDLNVYGNYKQGFLSGGYNGSSDVVVPGQLVNTPDYGPEKVRGFELGVKANLLDNTLRVNLAAFHYKALGLQVASYQQGFSTIRNAGKVDIKGVEGDFKWRPSVKGLEIHGAFAYTRSIYKTYTAPCYTGQTQELGCTINLYNDPLPQTQDLAGTQVPNAPYWVLNGGFYYDTPIGSGFKMGLSADANFNTSYVTDSKNTPFSRSPKQLLIDASVKIGDQDDHWEVAFIGRNLTNRYFWNDSQEHFPTGAGTGGPPGTVSIVGDRTASISRGRELWVRLAVSY